MPVRETRGEIRERKKPGIEMPSWDEAIEMLSKSRTATGIASSALKAVNVMGEAGVPGAKSLMEWIDDKAYRIGAQSANPGRGQHQIQAVTDGREPMPETDYRTFDGFGENYSGIFDENQSFTNVKDAGDDPNLLKIFLGIEENTLPESEYKPTSWTKGDPEQGWRSIKEYSSLEVSNKEEFINRNYPDLNDMKDPGMRDYYMKEFINLEFDGVSDKINDMRSAVARGEYTPDMAVKRGSFPGLNYDTRVNVGHLTKSIGYDTDRKQYYMSAADVWDFDPEQYTEIWGNEDIPVDTERLFTQASLMQAAGKPIGLYDRYYLDDSYMDDWYGKARLDGEPMEEKIVESLASYPES